MSLQPPTAPPGLSLTPDQYAAGAQRAQTQFWLAYGVAALVGYKLVGGLPGAAMGVGALYLFARTFAFSDA